MKDAIKELGSLCKMAAELERKWDQGGQDYLELRLTGIEYTEIVAEYLKSVRRLEEALSNHLVAVTHEVVEAKKLLKQKHDQQDHPNPAS